MCSDCSELWYFPPLLFQQRSGRSPLPHTHLAPPVPSLSLTTPAHIICLLSRRARSYTVMRSSHFCLFLQVFIRVCCCGVFTLTRAPLRGKFSDATELFQKLTVKGKASLTLFSSPAALSIWQNLHSLHHPLLPMQSCPLPWLLGQASPCSVSRFCTLNRFKPLTRSSSPSYLV